MNRDFEITDGIYLVQSSYELDLHNNFDFAGLQYPVKDRTLLLSWLRSAGEWLAFGTPASVNVEFREVSEFRFLPRDAQVPFTQDDCMDPFGYWTDEDWTDGVIVAAPNQSPDPRWLTAINFMSGAVSAVRATSAHAQVDADPTLKFTS